MLDYRLVPPATLQARQVFRAPSVYLDHWAFRKFSSDHELRRELLEALADRGGTLALGRTNLLEFSRVTDSRQLMAAEHLVQRVMPHIYFLDGRPMPVVQSENDSVNRGTSGDIELFEEFGRPLLQGPVWQVGLLFDRLRLHREDYARAFNQLQGELVASMNQFKDVPARAMAAALQEARRRPRATLGLARALVGEIFRDKRRELDLNDASDMLHTVVPCAYCDFVLLDAEWCDYVRRARRRLMQGEGADHLHIARVYSHRAGGLRQFLRDLRAHPKDPRPVPDWP